MMLQLRMLELQWGRRNSPAETRCGQYHDRRNPDASMGPPEFTGGNGVGGTTVPAGSLALQWGRRNSPAETRPGAVPQFRVSLLQWGRRNSPAETLATWSRRRWFSSLQWGRRNSPAETRARDAARPPQPRCFNGAAGIHRRKHGRVPVHDRCGTRASMGPPEFTGGNSWSPGTNMMENPELQWGRRNSPAETDLESWESQAEIDFASMGPPEFTGGNVTTPLHATYPTIASMGPPEFTGGNFPSEGWVVSRSVFSFNGAAGIHRRKLTLFSAAC